MNLSSSNELVVERVAAGGAARIDAQFAVDGREVRIDRAAARDQFLCHLRVAIYHVACRDRIMDTPDSAIALQIVMCVLPARSASGSPARGGRPAPRTCPRAGPR